MRGSKLDMSLHSKHEFRNYNKMPRISGAFYRVCILKSLDSVNLSKHEYNRHLLPLSVQILIVNAQKLQFWIDTANGNGYNLLKRIISGNPLMSYFPLGKI